LSYSAIVNILGLTVLKIANLVFVDYSNPPTANPPIFYQRTESMKHLFKKVLPLFFSALSWENYLKFDRRLVLQNNFILKFELEYFKPVYLKADK
jgi:hypothetical protein